MVSLKDNIKTKLSKDEAKQTFSGMQEQIDSLTTEVENSKLAREAMQVELLKVKQQAVNNEHYSRKNNIKIYGLT